MTLLNPTQAAQYLTDHGKPIEKSKLATLRNNGGGPSFLKEDDGKFVWYDTDDLDGWSPMEKKPKPMTKYNSTSEYRKKK
jgi:hypothetical protein